MNHIKLGFFKNRKAAIGAGLGALVGGGMGFSSGTNSEDPRDAVINAGLGAIIGSTVGYNIGDIADLITVAKNKTFGLENMLSEQTGKTMYKF
jgi:membrane protein YqaA with SNARE-associated domain